MVMTMSSPMCIFCRAERAYGSVCCWASNAWAARLGLVSWVGWVAVAAVILGSRAGTGANGTGWNLEAEADGEGGLNTLRKSPRVFAFHKKQNCWSEKLRRTELRTRKLLCAYPNDKCSHDNGLHEQRQRTHGEQGLKNAHFA
jgi:hypothetical protein